MKKIIHILSTFLKADFNAGYYISCFLFCMVMVVLQYVFRFPFDFFAHNNSKILEYAAYFLLYGCAFIIPFLLYRYFNKHKPLSFTPKVYIHIFLIILLFTFRSGFSYYRLYVPDWFDDTKFGYSFADNLFQALALFIPLIIIYYIFRFDNRFYGLTKRPQHLKSYLYMLIIMLPIVFLASTQNDFQHQYPNYHSFAGISATDYRRIVMFELIYLFDFIAIELFFRGYLIFTLKPHLGRAVILPMVCMYVSIHLWKPAGETISSFFGGLVLGILAYETGSIWGGIIAHCGVALMMELFGSMYI